MYIDPSRFVFSGIKCEIAGIWAVELVDELIKADVVDVDGLMWCSND
jgi:hypothetical protein